MITLTDEMRNYLAGAISGAPVDSTATMRVKAACLQWVAEQIEHKPEVPEIEELDE